MSEVSSIKVATSLAEAEVAEKATAKIGALLTEIEDVSSARDCFQTEAEELRARIRRTVSEHQIAVEKLKAGRNKAFEVLNGKHVEATKTAKVRICCIRACLPYYISHFCPPLLLHFLKLKAEHDEALADREAELARLRGDAKALDTKLRKERAEATKELEARVATMAADHSSTVQELNASHAKASREAAVLLEERAGELATMEDRQKIAAEAASELRLKLEAAEGTSALLAQREEQLKSAEQRLGLLEAEEGRIEELEDLLKERERERDEAQAALEAAAKWETKHQEASELLKRKEEFTATLTREKDDIEKKQFEADLKTTRLQSELLSSKKALRQAVTQLQQLEMEAEQERIAVNIKPKSAVRAADGAAGAARAPPTAASSSSSSPSSSLTSTPTPRVSTLSRTGGIPINPSAPGWQTPTSALMPPPPPPMSVGDRVSRIRDRMQDLLKQVRFCFALHFNNSITLLRNVHVP